MDEQNRAIRYGIAKIAGDDAKLKFHGYLVFVVLPMGWHTEHEDKFSKIVDLLAFHYFFYCSSVNSGHGGFQLRTTWIFKMEYGDCFIHNQLKKNRSVEKRIVKVSRKK